MNAAGSPAGPARWSARRWWATLLLVLAVQLGLIYWLSDRRPPRVRAAGPTPSLQLVQTTSELLELTDPTLFALPQSHGFSGRAWSELEPPDLRPTRSVQQPLWLDLPAAQLGADFRQFSRTNVDPLPPRATAPAPEVTPPTRIELGLVAPRSRVRLGGDLAGQPVPETLQPPSWPYPDLLPDTVVQVVLNPEGRVVSTTRLAASGHAPADQYAVDAVRAARFAPAPAGTNAPHAQLRWGQVTFQWHTTAPANGAGT